MNTTPTLLPEFRRSRRQRMLEKRLDGLTYAAIATAESISRQRVQQILGPPSPTRKAIVERYAGLCANCGIHVDGHGHVHHRYLSEVSPTAYEGVENLQLLCVSCHRNAHTRPAVISDWTGGAIRELRLKLRLTQQELADRIGLAWGDQVRVMELGIAPIRDPQVVYALDGLAQECVKIDVSQWTGENIRELRCRLGLTQVSFAQRLRTGQSAVSAWERGKTIPSFYRLRTLDALDAETLQASE